MRPENEISSSAHIQPRRPLPTTVKYYLIATCIITAILANLSGYLWADVDLFTRAAVGKIFMITGDAPYKDLFAYTPTKEIWHDHEVIPGILIYLLTRTGSDISIYLARIVFAIFTLLLILFSQTTTKTSSRHLSSLLLFFFTAWACQIFWYSILRAHSFSALFFAAFLFIFVHYRNSLKSYWLIPLPVLMSVWVNAHGGFTLGLLSIGAFFGGFFLDRFIGSRFSSSFSASSFSASSFSAASFSASSFSASPTSPPSIAAPCIALTLSIVATTLNFYGLSFLTFIADALLNPPSFIRVDPPAMITEWAPLTWSSFEGITLLIAIILSAIGLKSSRHRPPTEAWLLLALTLYAGISHARFVPFTFITLSAYFSDAFCAAIYRLTSSLTFSRQLISKTCVLLAPPLTIWFCTLALIPLFNWRSFSLNYDKYPVSALSWLTATQPSGRLMTSYDSGSFALWRVYPRFKISLDGRFDGVFPVETLQMVFGAYTTRNPRHLEYFNQLDPDYILIEANSPEEQDAEKLFPDRFRLYDDRRWIILGRAATTAASTTAASTTTASTTTASPPTVATQAPEGAITPIWRSEWDSYPQIS